MCTRTFIVVNQQPFEKFCVKKTIRLFWTLLARNSMRPARQVASQIKEDRGPFPPENSRLLPPPNAGCIVDRPKNEIESQSLEIHDEITVNGVKS